MSQTGNTLKLKKESTLVRGGHSKSAVVNQKPKKAYVNTPNIEAVKNLGGASSTVDALAGLIVGSDHIIVEPSEDGSSLVVEFDSHEIPAPTLEPLTMERMSANEYESDEGFEDSTLHVLVELETNGAHYGASFDLFPYNGSPCMTVFTMVYGGSFVNCFAYVTEAHRVHIHLPADGRVEARYFIYN